MPHRPNHKVCTELVDLIYDLFVREGVPYGHVREIRWDLNLLAIWHTLYPDMRTFMHHVFSSLTLIQSLQVHARSTSYSKDEALGASHHDYFPIHSLGE